MSQESEATPQLTPKQTKAIDVLVDLTNTVVEVEYAGNWITCSGYPLSCHRFGANEARLCLRLPAHNLGNLGRRPELPNRIEAWSLTSPLQRLVRTGDRLV